MRYYFRSKRVFAILSAAAIALAAVVACSDSFLLEEIVDGPDRKPLTISPTSTTLTINTSVIIETSGGIPPYTYSIVSGSGTLSGNVYTAPSAAGTERVLVRDKAGNTAYGVYTVESGSAGLGISPSSQTVRTGESVSFSAIGGTSPYVFSMTTAASGGSVTGAGVYTAGGTPATDVVTITDANLDTATATVTVLAKNLEISPQAITVYTGQAIDFSAVGGDGPYAYAITTNASGATMVGNAYSAGPTPGTDSVTLTDQYDGRTRTATITVVSVATNVDYSPSAVAITSAGIVTGSSFDADFTITNVGTAAGSRNVSWTLYASTDTSIGGSGDQIVASGSIVGGIAAGSYTPVTATGAWPMVAGNYYLLVDINADDDLNSSNNHDQSATTRTVVAPLTISPVTTSVFSGGQVSFTVSGGSGSSALAIPVTGSGSPSLSGNVYTAGSGTGTDTVTATDSVYPTLTATASVTVQAPPDVDYTVYSAPGGGVRTVGATISESFTIRNVGSSAGSSAVYWWAYLSADPYYGGGDTLVASGSISALGAGAISSPVSIGGATWPSTSGTKYLMIRLQAADETDATNNIGASALYSITEASPATPDYVAVSISRNFPMVTAESAISETFSLMNLGSTGTADISWTAWASTDAVLGGDTQVGNGTITGGLAAGATATGIHINGYWPNLPGNFYLIVQVDATDETNRNDVSVSGNTYTLRLPPDYLITNAVLTAMENGGNVGETLQSAASGVKPSFQVRENAGQNGLQTITWSVFRSSDQILGTGDVVAANGTIPALEAGQTSSVIEFNDTLPGTPGAYYYIIHIESQDDKDQTNNLLISSATYCWRTVGNNETSSDINNDTLDSADDYFIKLNAGDSVQINGLIDQQSYFDLFRIRTGSTTGLSITATWATGKDHIDLYVFGPSGTQVASSQTTSVNVEPSVPPLAVSVSANSTYYVGVFFYPTNPPAPGEPYVLTIGAN